MLIEFKLSMPNVGSWNGKWTGESNYYARVIKIGKGKAEIAKQILDKGSFYYNFGDGWGMSVNVRRVDSKEATKIRKKSKGFCGYDWAIESILQNQEIKC
jgi:hypothetical protein